MKFCANEIDELGIIFLNNSGQGVTPYIYSLRWRQRRITVPTEQCWALGQRFQEFSVGFERKSVIRFFFSLRSTLFSLEASRVDYARIFFFLTHPIVYASFSLHELLFRFSLSLFSISASNFSISVDFVDNLKDRVSCAALED